MKKLILVFMLFSLSGAAQKLKTNIAVKNIDLFISEEDENVFILWFNIDVGKVKKEFVLHFIDVDIPLIYKIDKPINSKKEGISMQLSRDLLETLVSHGVILGALETEDYIIQIKPYDYPIIVEKFNLTLTIFSSSF